ADNEGSTGGRTTAPTPYSLGSPPGVLGQDELQLVDAWWRAANYLAVGQIYLLANPLLREPLQAEHVKPRLLGHFGTVPGLNLAYVHANRGSFAWESAGRGPRTCPDRGRVVARRRRSAPAPDEPRGCAGPTGWRGS